MLRDPYFHPWRSGDGIMLRDPYLHPWRSGDSIPRLGPLRMLKDPYL